MVIVTIREVIDKTHDNKVTNYREVIKLANLKKRSNFKKLQLEVRSIFEQLHQILNQ